MSVLVWFRDKFFGKKVEETPVVVPARVEPPITTQVTESKPKRKRAAPKKAAKKVPARKKK